MAASTLALQTTVEYFETIYEEARGDAAQIPWSDGRPKPALVNWLNAVAPSLLRCGSRVAVVGCGLGEDARELIKRGYDVTAFDCSRTAVSWANKLDPENSRCYFTADLFNPPAKWKHRFDLVVEINTIQALVPERQAEAVKAIAGLMSPHGHLLVICRASEEPASIDDGPPWALTCDELLSATTAAGLKPASAAEAVTVFMDDEDPPVRRMRALFKRA